MATLKQRLHKKNASGQYDTIHLETSADLVLMTDGKTKLSDKITSIETNLNSVGFPSGAIVIWSGATNNIPSGWKLCDGSNNTPDLRNRFVVGAGNTYAVNATGGEATHTLTTNEMPGHTHSVSGSVGSHTHTIPYRFYTGDGVQAGSNRYVEPTSGYWASPEGTIISGAASGGSFSGTATSAGGGAAHNNMPPYYALCYIMKT